MVNRAILTACALLVAGTTLTACYDDARPGRHRPHDRHDHRDHHRGDHGDRHDRGDRWGR